MKFCVTVPASTSNIGPGYDCLGMAVSLYADFIFETADKFSVTGCPEEFQGMNNLVLQSYLKIFEKLGREPVPVRLCIRSDVPVARGLGSSSTCIAGGLLAANTVLGSPLSTDDLFQTAAQIEGHPDNAAPAFFGGLTASFVQDGRSYAVPFSVEENWLFPAVIPNYEVVTHEARKVVRKDIRLSDAVHSVSHAIAMVRALETGNEALAGLACHDLLHEPYRKALIAQFDELKALAAAAGCAAFFISGSGSTMMAATRSRDAAQAFCDAALKSHPEFSTRILKPAHEGAHVIED